MNIVFITAIKSPTRPDRSEAYKYSIESWKRWCKSNGCVLYVLDEPLMDTKPNYFRYFCFELLKDVDFEKICLVDADTIIHPDCPNFFELSPKGSFTAVHNDGDYDWTIRSIENYQYEFPDQFNYTFDIWKYFNSGFIVIDKSCKPLFDEFVKFFIVNHDNGDLPRIQAKYGCGTDQPLINLFVQKSGIHLNLLPYQFNMQDLSRKNILDDRMLFTEIKGIYHFNAISPENGGTNHWIQKTYNYLYENNN